MTDDASRLNGSLEPVVFDEEEKQLLRAAFDPAPARVEAVKGAVVARIAALAATGAGAGAASTASAAGAETARGVAAAGSAGTIATTSAGLSWGAAHWLGTGVIAAVVAGGAALALRSSEPAVERSATAHAKPVAREAAPTIEPAAVAITKQARPTALAPHDEAVEHRGATPLLRSRATRKTAAHDEHEGADGAHAASPRATEEKPASTPAAPEKPAAQAEPRPLEQPVGQPVAESLGRELAVLRKARAALERGSAALALGVLDEYDALFPQGVLRQEELATRTLALCAAGREYEARVAARTLARLAPRSPHLIRLADSCALRETTSEPDGDDATDEP